MDINKVLIFAKVEIGKSAEEIDIIKLDMMSILEYRNKLWIKKDTRYLQYKEVY